MRGGSLVVSSLALLACVATVGAPLFADQARAGAAGAAAFPTTPSAGHSSSAAQVWVAGEDRAHVLQVIANLRADPPGRPVVVLLGGSAARESTISDADWRAQIEALGGPVTDAYNLGSANRILATNVAIVKALPKVPTIVYVGIGPGAYTSARRTATISLPAPVTPLPPYVQHPYSQSSILSVAKKKALPSRWLAKRYPIFTRNYSSNLKTLGRVIVACRRRGLHPVLLELPRNTAIVGHAFDDPVARYTSGCRALAKKYGVPWVSFVRKARLPNADFYDLWHLVEPGRAVWQDLLSAKTVRLLRKYGMTGAAP